MIGPTAHQLEVLGLIKQHIAEHGFAPSMRELKQRLGVISTQGVHAHLRALERKGLLRRAAFKSRAIRLTAERTPSRVPYKNTDGIVLDESRCKRCGAARFGHGVCFVCRAWVAA